MWSIITHKDMMGNSIPIVNNLQGHSYGRPIIFCLLEETLFSPSLLSEHTVRYCSHHYEPKVWISKIHQIPLQYDPIESLSPLSPRESRAWCYCAFKYTWDQNKNHYSAEFREGQVITGRWLLLGSLKHHVPNPSHTDPERVKFSVAWQAADFLLEKLIIS